MQLRGRPRNVDELDQARVNLECERINRPGLTWNAKESVSWQTRGLMVNYGQENGCSLMDKPDLEFGSSLTF